MNTADLVERLQSEAAPVEPLAPPLLRAARLLAFSAAVGIAIVLVWGDVAGLAGRYAGENMLMAVELSAVTATAILAVAGAFVLSVPGRSRVWLAAPLPPFLLWAGASGLGCYRDLARLGSPEGIGHAGSCLMFILGAGIAIGGPLLWRLSRARPIDPLPVAILGGLGSAALAALLLQFFHPFALTVLDLGVHFAAVLTIVAVSAFLRRQALAPA